MIQADRDQSPGEVRNMRTKEGTLQQMALISSQATAREKASLKTQYGIRDQPNPLLKLSLDLRRLSRCEILTPHNNTSFHVQEYTCRNSAHYSSWTIKYLLISLM